MSSYYKYCVVPLCTNTTTKTPTKIFIRMPKDANLRRKWSRAMKRDERRGKSFSTDTRHHVCEDHFNVSCVTIILELISNFCRYFHSVSQIQCSFHIIPSVGFSYTCLCLYYSHDFRSLGTCLYKVFSIQYSFCF
jgi:hypothetical protein